MPIDPAWLEELSEWLRIPSVSADPAHQDDVRARRRVALRRSSARAGGECELVDFDGRPLAIGELRASTRRRRAPTVLVYGHFDVQPPAPLDLWESPPFEPTIRDEWLYARGVADDKGQLYLLLKAAALLAAEGALPVNVRIACDGEEEIGGHTIVDWIARGRARRRRGRDLRRAHAAARAAGVLHRHARRLLLPRPGRGRASATCTRARSAAPRCTATHALMRTLSGVLAGPRRPPARAAAQGRRPADRAGARRLGVAARRARRCSPARARGRWTRRAAEEFYVRTWARARRST